MTGNAEWQRQLGSIEELLRKVESAANPELRATVQELIELVMQVHGAGLERILDLARSSGDAGEQMIRELGADELISSLLSLYGIHPAGMEARVTRALEKVASHLSPHGASVELIDLQDGAVRLRLNTEAHGCGSNGQTLRTMVEEAVYEAAPDLTTLTIESAEAHPQSFVPLSMLLNHQPIPAGKSAL